MEIIIIVCGLIIKLGTVLGAGVLLGFPLGILYARLSYYDGSEKTGARKSDAWQIWLADCFLVTLFRRHYVMHRQGYINRDGARTEYVPSAYYDALLETQESKPVVFAGHPHGLFAIGSLLMVGLPEGERRGTTRTKPVADMWRRVVPCVHRHVFAVPFLRDLALLLGAVDVTRDNMTRMLESRSIYVAPGGCREMIIETDGDGVQKQSCRHTGFLSIAYQEKRLVYPMIHRGQERVFVAYSCDWLNQLRHTVLDLTGYPFPTLFTGPWPSAMTTYLCEPHDPAEYKDEEAFVNAYFEAIRLYSAAAEK